MNYGLMLPPPELSEYVRFFWFFETKPGNGDHYIYRTMGSGFANMIFNYKGYYNEITAADDMMKPNSSTSLYGQTAQFRRFKASSNMGIFGVCLYPYSIPCLFNIPASAITDQSVALNDLLGLAGNHLEEQVMLSESNVDRMRIVSEFLRSKLKHVKLNNTKDSHAVQAMIDVKGLVTIPQLADAHFLSKRQFERRFKELSGFNAKSYSRIIRFQNSVDKLTTRSSALMHIAHDSGYYDQSHFTNDFAAFSGFSPKHFMVKDAADNKIWIDFVAFFQFLSYCPPVTLQ